MLLPHDAHHSLEQALAEADGREQEHDEQRLRRANVSPLFSSCKAPHELTRLGSGAAAATLAVPPLQFELSGAFADSANPKSLSRASSWHDFSLLSDAGEFQRAAPSTNLLAMFEPPVESTSDAWDAVLDETKTPGGIPLAFALKTPTNDAFPAFFEREDTHKEEPALSPTHMDRKVLVTDNDLRLAPSTPTTDGYALSSHRGGPRSKREKLFPQGPSEYHVAPMKRSHTASFYDQAGEQRKLRRLPELSHTAGHYVLVPAEEQHERRRLHAQQMMAGRGRAIPMTPTDPPLRPNSSSRKRKIGIYTPEARKERLRRFHEKRKQRVFHKRVKYDCRKRLANACPRIKGRFVSKEEFEEAMRLESSSSTSSEGSPGV